MIAAKIPCPTEPLPCGVHLQGGRRAPTLCADSYARGIRHFMKSKLTAVALAAIVVAGTAAATAPASAAQAAPTRCHTADLKAGFALGDDARPEMNQTEKQTQAYIWFHQPE